MMTVKYLDKARIVPFLQNFQHFVQLIAWLAPNCPEVYYNLEQQFKKLVFPDTISAVYMGVEAA